jgi:hypothetical protein
MTPPFGNQSESSYSRLLARNTRFIEGTPARVVDRKSGKSYTHKNENIVQVLQFASTAESRKPTARKKKKETKLENFQILGPI